MLCLKSQAIELEEVSTGSGSDRVAERHAILLLILDPDGLPTRYRRWY